MFIVLRKVESKVWMGNKNAQRWSDRFVGRRRKAAGWVLDDYTGLKNILKEPQEHGMGKGLPCFWGCWPSLVGHLRHCHWFFKVPFLWKDLGHLIPIGKVMGHDSGLGGWGGVCCSRKSGLPNTFWRHHCLHHWHHHWHPREHLLSMFCVCLSHILWWVHDMDYLTL